MTKSSVGCKSIYIFSSLYLQNLEMLVCSIHLPANLDVAFIQENLRKRVASVSYEDVYDGDDATYEHGTHYSYDIHGNVKTMFN